MSDRSDEPSEQPDGSLEPASAVVPAGEYDAKDNAQGAGGGAGFPSGNNPAGPEKVAGVDEFERTLGNSIELERSEPSRPNVPQGSAGADIPGYSAMQPFLHATVFTKFFQVQAHIRYAHADEQGRVQQLALDRPRLYKWCVRADFAMRCVAVAMIYGAIGLTAFGIIHKSFFG